jgi:hypothetical protein
MTGGACLGIAVPSYRGAEFLRETVASALSQVGVAVRVVVGLDGPDPDAEHALALFRDDPRLRVVVRAERLGWVANASRTLSDVLAEGVSHAAVLPHDDDMLPDYGAAMVAALRERPDAAVAYSDIEMFGAKSGPLVQDSVEGSPYERVATLMRDHYNAIPFRGVMLSEVARRVLPIRGNAAGDFAADTAWMFQMAREGALIRVPRLLHRKRYHAANTHATWHLPSRTERVAAWAVHVRQCWEEAVPCCGTDAERAALLALARARLWWAPRHVGELSAAHRAMLVAAEEALGAEVPA